MGGILKDSQYTAGPTVSLNVQDTAVSLPASIIQPTTGDWHGYSATCVWITPIANPIYFAQGGAIPDVAGLVGQPLFVGDQLELKNFKNILALQMIRQGTTNTRVMVTPFFNDVGK